MNFVEFQKNFNSIQNAVFLLEGEDAYFREKGIETIVDKFVTVKELDYNVINGDTLNGDFGSIVSNLLTPPFISDKRVVLVREMYLKPEAIKWELNDYLQNPNYNSVLIISNSKPSDALKKFSTVCVVDCDKADEELLIRWVIGELKKEGISISFANAKKVVDYSLFDMTKIACETEKLKSFAEGNSQITSDDVEALVVKENDYKIYELTENIAKKDFLKAITILNDMLAQNDSPQMISASLYNYFRRLLHISLSGKNDSDLAKEFGIKEYAVKKARIQSEKFKKKSLKKAVDILTDSDYGVKAGLSDMDVSLMLNVFKIMTESY